MRKKLAVICILLALASGAFAADTYYQNFNDNSDASLAYWKLITALPLTTETPTFNYGLIVDRSVYGVSGYFPSDIELDVKSAFAIEWAPAESNQPIYWQENGENLAYQPFIGDTIGLLLTSSNHAGVKAVLKTYTYQPSSDNDALINAYTFAPGYVAFLDASNSVITDAATLLSLQDVTFSNTFSIIFNSNPLTAYDFTASNLFIDAVGTTDVSNLTTVPEPSSIALLSSGLVGLLGFRKIRK